MLVAAGGKVTYTMTLKTGNKELPGGNQLNLDFSRPGVRVVGGTCNDSTADEYVVGVVLHKTVPANTNLTCSFEVQPNTTDQDAAMIAPFTVTANFVGPNTTNHEYYIPTDMTPSVLVYAGGILQFPGSEIVLTNGTWFTGWSRSSLHSKELAAKILFTNKVTCVWHHQT